MKKPAIFLIAVLCVSMFGLLIPRTSVSAVTQYQVTFNQIGIGTNYTGPVVNIDGVNYTAAVLPMTFTWDSGSAHTYTFYSYLNVTNLTQYTWESTAGLSTTQSGTITVTGTGSVTATYTSGYIVDFLNQGKLIDASDVFYFIDAFIQYNETPSIYNPKCDLNHDGVIDTHDFFQFLEDYILYWQTVG